MTTVAWDIEKELQIASDGLALSGQEIILRDVIKYVIKDGVVFCCTGTHCLLGPLIQWWESGAIPEHVPKAGEEHRTWLLVFDKSDDDKWRGKVYSTDIPYAQDLRPRDSWGSGAQYAGVALHLGKSPVEALQTAAHFDVYTGGVLRAVDLHTLKETRHPAHPAPVETEFSGFARLSG